MLNVIDIKKNDMNVSIFLPYHPISDVKIEPNSSF